MAEDRNVTLQKLKDRLPGINTCNIRMKREVFSSKIRGKFVDSPPCGAWTKGPMLASNGHTLNFKLKDYDTQSCHQTGCESSGSSLTKEDENIWLLKNKMILKAILMYCILQQLCDDVIGAFHHAFISQHESLMLGPIFF